MVPPEGQLFVHSRVFQQIRWLERYGVTESINILRCPNLAGQPGLRSACQPPASQGAHQVFLLPVLSAERRKCARTQRLQWKSPQFDLAAQIESPPVLQRRVGLQSQASISVCNLGHPDNPGRPFHSRVAREGVTPSGGCAWRRKAGTASGARDRGAGQGGS